MRTICRSFKNLYSPFRFSSSTVQNLSSAAFTISEQKPLNFKINDPDWTAKAIELLNSVEKNDEMIKLLREGPLMPQMVYQFIHTVTRKQSEMMTLMKKSEKNFIAFIKILVAVPSKKLPREIHRILLESLGYYSHSGQCEASKDVLFVMLNEICILSKKEGAHSLFKQLAISRTDKDRFVSTLYNLLNNKTNIEDLWTTSIFLYNLFGDQLGEAHENNLDLADLIFKISLATRERLADNSSEANIYKAIQISNNIGDLNLLEENLKLVTEMSVQEANSGTKKVLEMISENPKLLERFPKLIKGLLLKNRNLRANLASMSCQDIFELSRVFDDQLFEKGEILVLMSGFLDDSSQEPIPNLFKMVSRGEDRIHDALIPMKRELILRFFIENNERFSFNGLLFLHFLRLEHKINVGKYDTILLPAIVHRIKQQSLSTQIEFFIKTKSLTKIIRKFPSYFSSLCEVSLKIIDSVLSHSSSPHSELQNMLQELFGSRELLFFPVFEFESHLDQGLVSSQKFLDLNDRRNEYLLFSLASSGARVFNYYELMRISFGLKLSILTFSSRVNYLYSLFIHGKIESKHIDIISKEIESPNSLNLLKKPQEINKILTLLLYNAVSLTPNKITDRLPYLKAATINNLIAKARDLYLGDDEKFVRDFKVIVATLKFVYRNVFKSLNEQTKSLFGDLRFKFSTNSHVKKDNNNFQNDFVHHLKLALGPGINTELKENVFLIEGDSNLECDILLTDLKIIIELYGPSHFVSEDLFLLKPQTLFMQAVKKEVSGFRLVLISYYEWMELSQPEDKKRFICKKLSQG